MAVLPIRADPMYEEIENFEDYELTQCVAYEMAIRNDDNIKAIDDVIEYYNKNKEHLYKGNEYTETFLHIIDLISDIEIVDIRREEPYYKYMKYFDNKFVSDDFIQIVKETRSMKRYLDGHLEPSLLDKVINPGVFMNAREDEEERDGFSIFTQILDGTDPNDFDTGKPRIYHSNGTIIIEKFKRPKIKISEFKTNDVILKVNVKKPLAELVALISHIQKNLEPRQDFMKPNQDVFRSPIELLGYDIKSADNKKISKALIADKFFAYDYKKAAIQFYKEKNEKKKKDYKADETLNYKEVNEKFKYTKDNPATEAVEDIEKILKCQKSTVAGYIKDMNEYINKKKYIELLTGIVQ